MNNFFFLFNSLFTSLSYLLYLSDSLFFHVVGLLSGVDLIVDGLLVDGLLNSSSLATSATRTAPWVSVNDRVTLSSDELMKKKINGGRVLDLWVLDFWMIMFWVFYLGGFWILIMVVLGIDN